MGVVDGESSQAWEARKGPRRDCPQVRDRKLDPLGLVAHFLKIIEAAVNARKSDSPVVLRDLCHAAFALHVGDRRESDEQRQTQAQ